MHHAGPIPYRLALHFYPDSAEEAMVQLHPSAESSAYVDLFIGPEGVARAPGGVGNYRAYQLGETVRIVELRGGSEGPLIASGRLGDSFELGGQRAEVRVDLDGMPRSTDGYCWHRGMSVPGAAPFAPRRV